MGVVISASILHLTKIMPLILKHNSHKERVSEVPTYINLDPDSTK